MKPIFEEHAMKSYARAQEIFTARGSGYGDTWRECNFLKMKAVADALSIPIPDNALRALATAAFLDMKYWRNLGGYNDDSLIDEMNYDAFLAEEMKQLIKQLIDRV